MVGKIVRMDLREAFKHEALDLTKWLELNIDVLGECVRLTLVNAERERAAGDFNVDIVAEDDTGAKVIIENQLEKSDHNHLGKLITYLVALEASIAIWIVSEPRAEHVSAITWLNESSSADFYLVKLEAIRIGDSEPAPLLTQIVGPSEGTKAVGKAKQEFAERHEVRREFWSGLLAQAKSKTKLHSAITPGRFSWISAGAGKRGIFYSYVVWKDSSAIELYIDRGEERENKAIFDYLHSEKDDIERKVGLPIEWQRLDNRRASRIRGTFSVGGWKQPETWPTVYKSMIDGMIRLEEALAGYIKAGFPTVD